MAGLMKPEKGGTPKKITTKNKPGSTGPWGENPARDRGKTKDAAPDTGGEESNVSPEEQAQYTEFVGNGLNLIYDEKGLQAMLGSLQGDGAPIEGLANTLVTVVSRLEDSAEQAGKPLDGDVMMHGSLELMEGLAEMSEKAGFHQFGDEDLETAFYLAADQYRAMRQEQGKLPDERLKADFQAILQAETNGTLNDMLPGIEEYAARAPQPGQG